MTFFKAFPSRVLKHLLMGAVPLWFLLGASTLLVASSSIAESEIVNNDLKSEDIYRHHRSSPVNTTVPNFQNVTANTTVHPYHSSYRMTQFAQPLHHRVKNNVESTDQLEKRYIWWVLAVVKLAETGWAMYQLISSCKDWSDNGASPGNTSGCLYGAVSTIITLCGCGVAVGNNYSAISDHLWAFNYSVGWKRDGSSKQYFSDLISNTTVAFANMAGAPAAMVLDMNNLPIYSPGNKHPVFMVQGNDGNLHRITMYDVDFNGIAGRLAIPINSNSTLLERDEQFNLENFSQGGLEFSSDFNQKDGGVLSSQNDFGQMDHEVSCEMGDLSGNSYQYQILDNNHQGTIGGGIIRTFQYDVFDSTDLNPDKYTWGLSPNPNCEVS